MGPPGGGCNAITNRYARHFSVVSVTAFDTDNMTTIFSTLVDWWLRKYSYGAAITKLAKPLVAATLAVYQRCQAELLPTPAKSHYTFNLRDVSKVVQGELATLQLQYQCIRITLFLCLARVSVAKASTPQHASPDT